MIKYYCDICKKDITELPQSKLIIKAPNGVRKDRDELICLECQSRINTYINRILRNNKNENNL